MASADAQMKTQESVTHLEEKLTVRFTQRQYVGLQSTTLYRIFQGGGVPVFFGSAVELRT